MLENISIYAIVGSYLASFTKLYLMLSLDGMQNIFRNKKFWIAVLLSGLYIYLSFILTDNVIKVVLEFITTIILSMYVLDSDKKIISNVIINCFIVWVGMLLIEVLFYTIIFLFLTKFIDINSITFSDNEIFKFISNNLLFFTLALCFINSKFRKVCHKLTHSYSTHSSNYIFVVIFASVVTFSIAVYLCLFNYDIVIILLTLFVMIVIYTIVVIVTIKEFNQKNKIQAEYDILLINLSEYENLLDIQRISNHENKNQLLAIKGMITKKDENVSEYIDSIIYTQYKDNEALMMKTNRIPLGGLRGLIYYKILTMKDKNINVNLDIDRGLRNMNSNIIPVNINQELCKIVGVFLDNAIQAVETLNEKRINILLSYDEKLIIKISNNYSGNIDLDKIDNKGYTTKGRNHGYGLSLVKNILKRNSNFINEREFNGKMFSQIIKLKII